MCTIIVLRDVRPDYPLVIATNRDEFYARETAGPARILSQPSTVGGRDLVGQGTWMGVTRDGLFVGVTNQRSLHGPAAGKRSRGEIVLHALSLGRTDRVTRYVRSLPHREYNDFNLMWGDARSLHVAYARQGRRELVLSSVPPGLHVLPNDELDSEAFVKVSAAKERLAPHLAAPFPALVRALEATLGDGSLPALEAIPDPGPEARIDRQLLRALAALCVRTPLYGTRSSTITALVPGAVSYYTYADGPPDQTPFVDVMGLF